MSPLLQVTLTIPRQKLSTTTSLTHCDVRFLGWNFSLIINKQTTLARGENPSCSRDGGNGYMRGSTSSLSNCLIRASGTAADCGQIVLPKHLSLSTLLVSRASPRRRTGSDE